MSRRLSIISLLAPLILSGCFQESRPYEVVKSPRVEIFDGERIVASDEQVIVKPTDGIKDAHDVATLLIQNTGDGVLSITDIRLVDDSEDVFSLSYPGTVSAQSPVLIQPKSSVGSAEFPVTIRVDPTNLKVESVAAIELTTNPDKSGKTKHLIPLTCELPQPVLSINPGELNFGIVVEGEHEDRTLQLVNMGTDQLVIHALSFSGDSGFSTLKNPSADFADVGEHSLTIDPGKTESITVRYTSVGPQAAAADLLIESNDPSQPNGVIVPLQANTGGPCIALNPGKLDFGGKIIGKIATMQVNVMSCGDQPLVIGKASLSQDSDKAFSLMQGQEERFPMVLGVNESASLEIAFVPTELATLDANGMPIKTVATLDFETNTYGRSAEVEISGYGVDTECPIPVISIAEGEEVCPQTKLHLVGSGSYSPNGNISQYEWEVVQPDGSVSLFLPSSSQPDPTFEANVAGSYTFRLRVTDANGQRSGSAMCPDATQTVLVVPCEAIHVELLWHTPNDMDETDGGPEAGADLDLHFLHPFAEGSDIDGDGVPDGYFDNPFDTFWFNDAPEWGAMDDPEDNPTLDLDDTDGAGPENLNLDAPEDGLTYEVGVHYWHDHGFGPSDATVRIYIHKVLVFEQTLKELIHCDLWQVAKIHWPSGAVTPIKDELGDSKISSFCGPPGWY